MAQITAGGATDEAIFACASGTGPTGSSVPGPSPRGELRTDPIVAWTGTRLLVWGGRVADADEHERLFADGAEYRE